MPDVICGPSLPLLFAGLPYIDTRRGMKLSIWIVPWAREQDVRQGTHTVSKCSNINYSKQT
jgi:hypothetical protein